jgi:hypothetical protein
MAAPKGQRLLRPWSRCARRPLFFCAGKGFFRDIYDAEGPQAS